MDITIITDVSTSVPESAVYTLKCEPDNEFDCLAIAAYIGSTRVGYVANKSTTALQGTVQAKDIHKDISLYGGKVLICSGPILRGKKYNQYEGKLFVSFNEGKNEVEYVTYPVVGGLVSNPAKKEILDQVTKAAKDKDSSPVMVSLKLATNGVVTVFPSGSEIPAGIIREPEAQYLFGSGNTSLSLLVEAGPGEKEDNQITFRVKIAREKIREVLSGAIRRIIDECINDESELMEKVEFMERSGFSQELILDILNQYEFFSCRDRIRIPYPKHPYQEVEDSRTLEAIASYVLCGKHCRLVGDKGCGKNTCLDTIDWLFNRPQFRVSLSRETDRFELLGSPSIKDGTVFYQPTAFVHGIEIGGHCILDEGNTCPADVLVMLHSLTDGARSVEIPGYKLVKAHPNSTVFLTMNENYMGTSRMNDATVDRFVPIVMKSDQNISPLLRFLVPTASEEDISCCQKIHEALLKSVHEGILDSTCITIRGFQDALESRKYLPLKRVLMDNIAGKPQDEDYRKLIYHLIENTCPI